MRQLHRPPLWLLFAALLPTPARAEDALTFRGSLSWLNAYEHTTPLDSDVNPGNRALLLPSDQLVSELRPNLKFSTGQLQLIARPRVEATFGDTKATGKERTTSGKGDSWLNEAFGQWTLNESTTFAYGIQSYQWGAAETLSPSNRLFHETIQQRDVLFEVRGKQLARLNFSLGKSFSTVVMGEVKDASSQTEEAPFQADVPYSSGGLVKPEYSWHEGADYVGLVFGARERGHGWVGEYFNVGIPFFDGLSVFGDASQERGSGAWYPEAGPGGVVAFVQSKADESKLYTLATGGLKFDFVNGTILRGEYVLNQAGYSKAEHELALGAFRGRSPAQLALREEDTRRFLSPGLEMPGQRLVYGSLHVPDFLTYTDLTLELRALASLRDGSAYTYAEADYRLGDNGTVSFAETATAGRRDGELKGYSSPTHLLAYRHDW